MARNNNRKLWKLFMNICGTTNSCSTSDLDRQFSFVSTLKRNHVHDRNHIHNNILAAVVDFVSFSSDYKSCVPWVKQRTSSKMFCFFFSPFKYLQSDGAIYSSNKTRAACVLSNEKPFTFGVRVCKHGMEIR